MPTSVGMPYVRERWLGGTLTNNETIRSSIRRLEGIETEMARPSTSAAQRRSRLATPASVVAFCATSKACAT